MNKASSKGYIHHESILILKEQSILMYAHSFHPSAIVHQAPLSMEFSRQEYWSGLPFPPPGDLLDHI